MAIRQVTTPNLNLPKINDAPTSGGSWRGWCLKYCDDGTNAQNRQPSAQAAYDVESRNGNVRAQDPPVGVWVPIFLKFNSGEFTKLGHVAWAYNHGNGRIEIHDSEVHAGARKPYNSIPELLAWFGKQSPEYTGYSYWLDGAKLIEDYEEPKPEPQPEPTPEPSVPTYTVKEGDTLGQIIIDQGWATDAGLWGDNGDVARVAAANGIADPNLIHPGQVITKA